MANQATVLTVQVRQAGLIDCSTADRLWEHGTQAEIAAELRLMLRRARLEPWWPDEPRHPTGQDPWEVLAATPDLTLVIIDGLPNLGRYYHQLRAIVLRADLDPMQQTVTLWHELIHAERGHDGPISHDEHEAVQREACRRAGVSFDDYPYLGGDRD